SYALQYGVPLADLVRNFSHMRFEPMGRTENRDIPVAQSIIDYVFRWLASRYMSPEDAYEVGVMTPEIKAALAAGQYPPPLSPSAEAGSKAGSQEEDDRQKDDRQEGGGAQARCQEDDRPQASGAEDHDDAEAGASRGREVPHGGEEAGSPQDGRPQDYRQEVDGRVAA